MKVEITRLTEDQIKSKGIDAWPIWTKEISKFDWTYDAIEHCLILKGEVIVEAYGEKYHIKKGDFVTFPKGMSCVWDIKEDIEKHYNFE